MSASEAGISFRELLAYNHYLADRWMDFFRQNPDALQAAVSEKIPTVGDLVFHLVLVEETFARFLRDGAPPAPPQSAAQADRQPKTPDILLQRHELAHEKFAQFLDKASDEDLRRKHEFFLQSRGELGRVQAARNVDEEGRVPWQGDYTRGRHADGDAGADDHQTRRQLRPFVE